MLSRRPRSWAIPGRGIWAGLALTPILIALAALIVSSFVGSAATARPTADAAGVAATAAKARVRPTQARSESIAAVRAFWTSARMARATDVTTGRPINPNVLGNPHTSFNWYPGFPRRPQHRSVLIFFTQGGTEHVCAGGVTGQDSPSTPAVEPPLNVVWTAGRCVHDGSNTEAGWSDNVVACPIYLNGPFNSGGVNEGCWIWNSESTTPEWYADNWESRDYGVVFMSSTRVDGRTGTDIANYPAANPKGTFDLCDEPSHTNCAYNLARAEHWWSVGYHNPDTLPPNPPPPPPPPPGPCGIQRSCPRGVLRVTQAQFASTHPALASVPAGGAADTGPLVNTTGDYEQAGLDTYPRSQGQFTGAPWLLNWNGNETRFGTVKINSNTSYADAGEDDMPNGAMQGVYFDTVTCFDYQAWIGWTGTC